MEIEIKYLDGDWQCYEKQNEMWTFHVNENYGTLVKDGDSDTIQNFEILGNEGGTENYIRLSVDGDYKIARLTVDLMKLHCNSIQLTFYRSGLTY